MIIGLGRDEIYPDVCFFLRILQDQLTGVKLTYHLVMTNSSPWKIPTINGGFVRWENHLFRLGPSIPWLC